MSGESIRTSIKESTLRQSVAWEDDEGIVYHRMARSEAPCKDFYQLVVTKDEVVLTIWSIISPFRKDQNYHPQRHRCFYQDFRHSPDMRAEIERRSKGELPFLDNLINGHINYLDRMEDSIQLKIISYLDVCSLVRMAGTNKHYKKMCANDDLWKLLYAASKLNKYVTSGLKEVAEMQGWKPFYIFVSKIAKSTTNVTNSLATSTRPSVVSSGKSF